METRRKMWMGVGVLALLVITFFIGLRTVPAVKVGGRSATFSEFFKIRDGLAQFRDLRGEQISDTVVEEGVIMSFIEDAILEEELERRNISEDQVKRFLAENLKQDDISKLQEATERLYGWSIANFEKYVLLPQVRRIMLVVELQKENINPDEWIVERKKAAKVSMYLPRWKWEEGDLESRY